MVGISLKYFIFISLSEQVHVFSIEIQPVLHIYWCMTDENILSRLSWHMLLIPALQSQAYLYEFESNQINIMSFCLSQNNKTKYSPQTATSVL